MLCNSLQMRGTHFFHKKFDGMENNQPTDQGIYRVYAFLLSKIAGDRKLFFSEASKTGPANKRVKE